MGDTYRRRFYSGLWFMLAGLTAGLCIVLYELEQTPRNLNNRIPLLVVAYLVIPGLLGGMSGFVLGGDILNSRRIVRARQAAVRGVVVSLVAWVVFAVILSSYVATESNAGYISTLLMLLIFGTALVGWLIAGLGAATGLLMYRLRRADRASGS